MSSNDNFWTGAIIAALIFWLFPFGKNKEFPTKTIYIGHCSDDKHSVDDCPSKLYVQSMTFRVFIEKQKVISKTVYAVDDGKEKCTVFDENNWRCESNSGNGSEGYWQSMIDGDYLDATTRYVTAGVYVDKDGKSLMPLYHQIPSTIYWWHYIKNMF